MTLLTATKVILAGIKEFVCSYDQNGNVTAVAHGIGGTWGPAMCRSAAGGGAVIVQGLGEAVARLAEIYDRCEMLEFEALDQEGSLANCEPLVSLILPRRTLTLPTSESKTVGGYLDSLIALVELRNWQLQKVRPQFSASGQIVLAQQLRVFGNYPDAYARLCHAYDLMQQEVAFTEVHSTNNGSGAPNGAGGAIIPILPDRIEKGRIFPRGEFDTYSFEVTRRSKIHVLENPEPDCCLEANMQVLRANQDGEFTELCSRFNVESEHGHIDLYCDSDSLGIHYLVIKDTGDNDTGKYQFLLRLLEPDAPEEDTCPHGSHNCPEWPF